MRKEFHKDYSRLSTYQRFSLVVKKLAREDKAEVRRLVNSCPTGRDQYTKLLNAARECTLLISLELQVMVGRWESFNTLVLPQLEAAHVDYFNTTFRNSPERVNKVGVIVGTMDDLLQESMARAVDEDFEDLLERGDAFMETFMEFLFDGDLEMAGGYASTASGFPDCVVDRVNCMMTCYILWSARDMVVSVIGPLWLAFRSLCGSEIRLEPEMMLEGFATQGVVDLVEEFRFELNSLDPELDVDKEAEASLQRIWRISSS